MLLNTLCDKTWKTLISKAHFRFIISVVWQLVVSVSLALLYCCTTQVLLKNEHFLKLI